MEFPTVRASTVHVVDATLRGPEQLPLDNGPQEANAGCSCPYESANEPTGLHLYEGLSGLISGGSPTVINGLQAFVSLDASNATMAATFPGVDQWTTISAAPRARTALSNLQQVALEKQILATVKIVTGSVGTS